MYLEKMMSPEGLAQTHTATDVTANMQRLLTADRWEDALAYWVNICPVEKLIAWLLPQLSKTPEQNDADCSYEADIRLWLKTHDDACRWRIFRQAETQGFDTPLGAVGLAIFWMGGSMTPAEYDAVYAEKHLPYVMICTALQLISIRLADTMPPFYGAQQLYASWSTSQERC